MKSLYRNTLKSRNFDKENPQNLHSERETIAERQGSSENANCEENPTQSKTDSSRCFDISIELPEAGAWKKKQLVFFNALVVVLLWSLFSPAVKIFWETLDVAFFKAINSTLRDSPHWQLFWALANHKLADWVEDLFVLGFFIAYVARAGKGMRARRVAELVFSVLYIALIIYFVNKTLFREHLEIPRLSPTLSVDNSVRLSDEISWLSIKDDSVKSFPGDHGTTALLFAASFSYFAGRRLGIYACLYAVFLCMPRLITGAHWLSDVIVGSGCIAIFFLSWAFCTPMGEWCIKRLEKLFLRVCRK